MEPLTRGERALTIVCLVIGFTIGAAAIDLLTGGKLAGSFTRPGRRLAQETETFLAASNGRHN